MYAPVMTHLELIRRYPLHKYWNYLGAAIWIRRFETFKNPINLQTNILNINYLTLNFRFFFYFKESNTRTNKIVGCQNGVYHISTAKADKKTFI